MRSSTRKIQSFLLKSLSQTVIPRPSSSYSSELALSEEVLHVLSTASSLESPLEPLASALSPHVIAAVLDSPPLRLPVAFRFFNWAAKRAWLRSLASFERMVGIIRSDPDGFQLAWECAEKIREEGVAVEPYLFEVLICAYVRSGSTLKAVECFGRMDEFRSRPSVFVYNSILSVLVKEGVFILATAIYNQMLKSNCEPNRTTFNVLINGHCREGKTSEALELFDEMSSQGFPPDTMVHNIVIHSLCRAQQMHNAANLLESMKRNDVPPCRISYLSLLNGYCRLSRMDEAFKWADEMRNTGFELGLEGHSSLIDGLFKCGRFEEACQWYSDLLNRNIQPDCVLYTTMIRGYVDKGRTEEAFAFLQEMTDEGIKPDTFCYNTLIKGLCDAGRLDSARSLQLEISKDGCFPNSATYTIIICQLCSEGLILEAQQIFEEMGEKGCFPTTRTFNALIKGLCKVGNLQEARIMFCKMETGRTPSVFLRISQSSNLASDKHRLKEIVERLCQSGHVAKAYNLLNSLAESGIVYPNKFTYGILINSYCKMGDFDRALNLFKDLQIRGLSPDTVTYATIINGLLRKNKLEHALVVFDRMLKSGCTPSPMVYNTVMKVLCRMKSVSQAVTLWLNYISEREDLSAEEAASIAAAKEQFGQGLVAETVRCLVKMDVVHGAGCVMPYCIWITGYCQDGKPEIGLQIFAVLQEFDVIATSASCGSLIHVLCKQNNLALAVDVMAYSIRNEHRLDARHGNFLLQRLCNDGKEDAAIELALGISRVGYDLEMYLDNRTKAVLYKT